MKREPWGSLRWWPTLGGIALAGFIALDAWSGSELAPILAASGLVYVGSAALGKPSAAWPVFLGTFLVIGAARIGVVPVDPTWVFLGLAVVFVGYGLLNRGSTPVNGGYPNKSLPRQAAAMVAVGTMAAGALIAGGDGGAYLVAVGLLGHAAWDVYHHWTNKVVARSMAEFCCVLDTLLAVAIVVAVVRQ